MVLCASAAISKAVRSNSLSPSLSLSFSERNNARYSLRINFFSWSSVRLYFGIAATVSMSILYEFTKKSPSFARFPEMDTRETGLHPDKHQKIEEKARY